MSAPGADYTADRLTQDGIEVVRLVDVPRKTEVLVAPSMGNNAYSMKVNGHQIYWSPFATLAEWKAKPTMIGNPFLAPWANRIDGDSYWANGRRYLLNAELKNIRKDGNGKPIHGLLTYASDWKVTAVEADARAARVTSRLEYWRDPDRMAQFPFAHNIEMTYRLSNGVLEVETVLENLSKEPMPVGIGYHPYYQLTDSPRDQWKVHVPARDHVVLSQVLVPTGEVKPLALADPVSLAGNKLDDVFTNLVRGADGLAVFWVQGVKQKVEFAFGPNYPVSVVYAPPGRGFICFEPMTGVTNMFNLGHEGKFPLQSVPAAGQWKESFWVRPSGF
jgi:aldose 1-epimerase